MASSNAIAVASPLQLLQLPDPMPLVLPGPVAQRPLKVALARGAIRMGASRLFAYESCERLYWFRYVAKLRSSTTDANLVFGTALHEAVEGYLRALYAGIAFDIAKAFNDAWQRGLTAQKVNFTDTWPAEDLLETGVVLASRFPAFWDSLELQILEDQRGLLMEREIHVDYGEFVLINKFDLLAADPDGNVISLDIKSLVQEAFDLFELVNDQLTVSQVCIEHPASGLGIKHVQSLGFVEGLKRKVPKQRVSKAKKPRGPLKPPKGTGPIWRLSPLAERRSEAQVNEFIAKLFFRTRQIKAGIFPKKTGYAHSSTCKTCSFFSQCMRAEGSVMTTLLPAPAAEAKSPF